MDTMIQLYMEDTEEMLQKGEDCLIRLETEYSSADINELFRIVHTIKGSSQTVGYEEIGYVMHKIEDMLDCARNGSIMFDRSIVSLCFKGLDIVNQMLQYKKEYGADGMRKELIDESLRVSDMAEAYIGTNKKKEEKSAVEQPSMGIVSALLNKKAKGKNKYYISFFIEDDAPMVSPVLIMILKSIDDIGCLIYSSVTDSYFSQLSDNNEMKSYDIILCTDLQETELYTYFALTYIDRINIVDLSREKLAGNDYFINVSEDMSYIAILGVLMKLYQILFIGTNEIKTNDKELNEIESLYSKTLNICDKAKNKDKISNFISDLNELFSLIIKMYKKVEGYNEELYTTIRSQLLKLIERAYYYIRGKQIFNVFKPDNKDFIDILRTFTERINKSTTLIIFIDLSNLDMLYEKELKALIEIKKQMTVHGIEMGIIVEGPDNRRMINIFDAISSIAEFQLFRSELDAVLGMFRSKDLYQRIFAKVKSAQDDSAVIMS